MNGNEAQTGPTDKISAQLNTSLLTYAECADLDKRTIAAGFSEIQLMGQAAAAVTNRILATRPFTCIYILCGSGNNGGDGYAIAWMLIGLGLGRRTRIFATDTPRSTAARFYANLVQAHLPTHPMSVFCSDVENTPGTDDLILDALLGVGQKGELRGAFQDTLVKLLALRKLKHRPWQIAIDCPTGLTEDSETVFTSDSLGKLPAPDEVYCLGSGKLALSLNASLHTASTVHYLPIGFVPEYGSVFEWHPQVLQAKRPLDHKYTAGSAWMIAGQQGMEGAAILCAESFFASGGGICELRTFEETTRKTVLASIPTLMTGTLPGKFTSKARVILVGPGIRMDSDRQSILLDLFESLPEDMSVILDASTCALVQDKRYPALLRPRTLITPHSGEWEKMGGPSVRTTNSFREAEQFARELGCYALVKSAISVLFGPRRSFVYPGPQAALAVAGSGDCLAGIVAALQGRPDALLESSALRGLDLLHAATAQQTHPGSHDFPRLIRLAFEKS